MIAYLDCFSGASGDMILAALIDAGADLAAVDAQLTALGIPFELTFTTVHRCGLRACKVDISAPDGTWTVMRTYEDGLRLVQGAGLDPEVAARAVSILGRLARAEAKCSRLLLASRQRASCEVTSGSALRSLDLTTTPLVCATATARSSCAALLLIPCREPPAGSAHQVGASTGEAHDTKRSGGCPSCRIYAVLTMSVSPSRTLTR